MARVLERAARLPFAEASAAAPPQHPCRSLPSPAGLPPPGSAPSVVGRPAAPLLLPPFLLIYDMIFLSVGILSPLPFRHMPRGKQYCVCVGRPTAARQRTRTVTPSICFARGRRMRLKRGERERERERVGGPPVRRACLPLPPAHALAGRAAPHTAPAPRAPPRQRPSDRWAGGFLKQAARKGPVKGRRIAAGPPRDPAPFLACCPPLFGPIFPGFLLTAAIPNHCLYPN